MPVLSPSPVLKFYKTDGITPAAGGKVFTYQTGSTTPLAAYTNAAGTFAANPIILDSNGEAVIFLDTSQAYRFTIRDSADVLIRTVDDVRAAPTSIATANIEALSVTTAKIPDDAVTFAKMQNLSGISLVGKSTAGSGDAQQVSISPDFVFSGTTLQATTTERVSALAIAAGVVTIDWSIDNYRTLVLSANVTSVVFSGTPAAGRAATVVIRSAQDATGGRTVAGWPASVLWSGGAFTPSAAANARDLISLTTHDQGVSYFGSYLKGFV